MYKVFINEKAIIFTNNQNIIKSKNNILILKFFNENLSHIIYNLLLSDDDKISAVIVCVLNVEETFNLFKKSFKLIVAAGGFVKNKKNEILFIFRLGKWDLPKGKQEKNETIEQTAIREVEEECGVKNLKLRAFITDTFHLYELKNKVIIKQTFWYSMETDFNKKLIPQTKENITEASWLNGDKIKSIVLKNTYPSIKEILKLEIRN